MKLGQYYLRYWEREVWDGGWGEYWDDDEEAWAVASPPGEHRVASPQGEHREAEAAFEGIGSEALLEALLCDGDEPPCGIEEG